MQTAAASWRVSPQTFARWNVAPVGRIGRSVYYMAADIEAARQARRDQLRARADAEQRPAAIDPLEQQREEFLLRRAQRIHQELKNAELQRELAPVKLLEWTLGRVASQIGAILDALPLKLKKVAPRITATELEHVKREIAKAQNAASRVTVDLDEYHAGDDSNAPADPTSHTA